MGPAGSSLPGGGGLLVEVMPKARGNNFVSETSVLGVPHHGGRGATPGDATPTPCRVLQRGPEPGHRDRLPAPPPRLGHRHVHLHPGWYGNSSESRQLEEGLPPSVLF